MDKSEQLAIKRRIGQKAAELVQDGMRIGIGSGSTAVCFIESLIERCRRGLKVQAASTSISSARLAAAGGIALLDDKTFGALDLCIDGADEIAPDKSLIKGGGGNLVREKLVAISSKEMVVIADETKLVKRLGAFGLPVEILPFACASTLWRMHSAGFFGRLRHDEEGSPFVTDNGNYIVDLELPATRNSPAADHAALKAMPGVVDTGLFVGIAGRILIGYADGRVDFYEPKP